MGKRLDAQRSGKKILKDSRSDWSGIHQPSAEAGRGVEWHPSANLPEDPNPADLRRFQRRQSRGFQTESKEVPVVDSRAGEG